ncbi:MAG: response regulator transcription factor, partial [Chloroflexota bacterium]
MRRRDRRARRRGVVRRQALELHRGPITTDQAGGAGDDPDRIRVVIVDDSPRTLGNLGRLLAFETGIEVAGTAHTAKAGQQEARRHHPDVMVVDVNLPDLDGIELTRQLRSELPATAVVLISVVDDAGHRRRGREAGAHSYLLKPFAGEELVAAVRAAHAPRPVGRRPATRRRPAADSTQELPQVA